MSTNVKKLGEESIHHFSHKHELFLCFRRFKEEEEKDSSSPPSCKACGSSVKYNEEYFSCLKCFGDKFEMHKWCAQLPQTLKHPFHEHHLLTLLDESPWRWGGKQSLDRIPRCGACGDRLQVYPFVYKCSEGCEFYMDLKCAMLLPTTNLVAKHKKLHHPHPLFACQRKLLLDYSSSSSTSSVAAAFRCGGCSLSFDISEDPDYSTIIYVCLECRALLHESCADLPQEIQHHPLHPHCTATSLTFHHSEIEEYPCKFCKQLSRLYFDCSVCSIKIDIRCALLTPCTTTTMKNKMNNIGHPHPLTHCNIHPISQRTTKLCDGCHKRKVESTCYYCYTCNAFLDESCAHNLPSQIQHPFHPEHDLFLTYPSDKNYELFIRKWCCTYARRQFAYTCHLCSFSLDVQCSSPPLYPMLNMPQLHQHPLSYIKGFKHYIPIAFKCTQCDYYIYPGDFPLLPPTIKAPWHRHPLTLIRDLTKHYRNFDILDCEVCEHKLERHASYVCAECDLFSHLHCVLSEVMNYLEEKATLVEELVGGTKLLHFFFDEDSGAIITRIMDMNDGGFDNFLCGIDKKIDVVNTAFVKRRKIWGMFYAQFYKKKRELDVEYAKLGMEKEKLDREKKELELVDKNLQPLRTMSNILSLQRSKYKQKLDA